MDKQLTADELAYLRHTIAEGERTNTHAAALRQQAMQAEAEAAIAEGVRNAWVLFLAEKYGVDSRTAEINTETGAILTPLAPAPPPLAQPES